jgi:hypothetical protein
MPWRCYLGISTAASPSRTMRLRLVTSWCWCRWLGLVGRSTGCVCRSPTACPSCWMLMTLGYAYLSLSLCTLPSLLLSDELDWFLSNDWLKLNSTRWYPGLFWSGFTWIAVMTATHWKLQYSGSVSVSVAVLNIRVHRNMDDSISVAVSNDQCYCFCGVGITWPPFFFIAVRHGHALYYAHMWAACSV